MKLETKTLGATLAIIIKGQITGISEVQEIKNIVESYRDTSSIELILEDAYVMPSSLIGYLVKLVNVDEKRIIINAQEDLKELLLDLSLEKTFILK